jgi:hypothetical protein
VKNRRVSRISGGQSATPILPAIKLKLQQAEQTDINRQRIEFGKREESDGASDMGSPGDLDVRSA